MRVEIIATGTELLTGNTPDTNSLFISEELMLIGLEPAFKTVVGDNKKDMEDALHQALDRVDLVIVTGGLGPTEDDVTREAVSKVLKKKLVRKESALKSIRERFTSRGREYLSANDRQAFVPKGALTLRNPVGIAPGFIIEAKKRFIAVLPGVPREMKAMFSEELRPWLEERFGGKVFIRRKILHTCGMSESAVNQAIENLLTKNQPLIGLSAKENCVDIRIVSSADTADKSVAILEKTEAEIRAKLGSAVYSTNGIKLEEIVGALLKLRHLKISVAESCTAGLVSGRLTNIPGSSEYFERGAITYSNLAKQEMLGVPKKLIERHGAVSPEVAAAMAQGIKAAAHTSLGLAVTGIAGPDGGTEEKPVGLVYISLADSHGVKTEMHRFLGSREMIRLRASQMALDLLRRHLM
jgi:nicotinamide-nucleotide amidase